MFWIIEERRKLKKRLLNYRNAFKGKLRAPIYYWKKQITWITPTVIDWKIEIIVEIVQGSE